MRTLLTRHPESMARIQAPTTSGATRPGGRCHGTPGGSSTTAVLVGTRPSGRRRGVRPGAFRAGREPAPAPSRPTSTPTPRSPAALPQPVAAGEPQTPVRAGTIRVPRRSSPPARLPSPPPSRDEPPLTLTRRGLGRAPSATLVPAPGRAGGAAPVAAALRRHSARHRPRPVAPAGRRRSRADARPRRHRGDLA
jgi:hypothetical protein